MLNNVCRERMVLTVMKTFEIVNGENTDKLIRTLLRVIQSLDPRLHKECRIDRSQRIKCAKNFDSIPCSQKFTVRAPFGRGRSLVIHVLVVENES